MYNIRHWRVPPQPEPLLSRLPAFVVCYASSLRLVVSHEFHFEWHEDMYRGALEVDGVGV